MAKTIATAAGVACVLMMRNPAVNKAPFSANVHPDMIAHYREGGFVLEEEADFELPDENAEALATVPPYDEAVAAAKRLYVLQSQMSDDDKAKFQAELTAFAEAEHAAAERRKSELAQADQLALKSQQGGNGSGGNWGKTSE